MKDRRRRWLWALFGAGMVLLLGIPTGLFWSLLGPMLHKDVINRYAAVYKIDPLLVMSLIKAESKFSKSARSRRGAVGLMQLMPETANEVAVKVGRPVPIEDLADPEVNIQLGIHYLSQLRADFKGDPIAYLAAYNAGPANVRTWLKDGALGIEEIEFPETRFFVRNVLGTYKWLRRMQKVKNAFNA